MKRKSVYKYLLYPFLSLRAGIMAKLLQRHIPAGSSILDIGCGNMLIAKNLKKTGQIKISGIDVIDMNLTDLPHKIFNGRKIPYPANSFDICLLVGVLHHAENQQRLLREAGRVSRKKIIIFEDVYFSGMGNFWLKVRDVIGNIPEELNMNFALKFQSVEQWKKIFREQRLKIDYEKVLFNYPRLTHHAVFVLDKNKR